VRKDALGKIPAVNLKKGYVESMYRESRDIQGNLTYFSGNHRVEAIKDMNVYDVEKDLIIRLGDLFRL